MDDSIPPIKKRFGSNPILNIFFIIAFALILGYYTLSAPLWNPGVANRQGTTVHVSKNETLNSIANDLEQQKIIRYAFPFKAFVYLFGAGRSVPRGDYLFTKKLPVWHVAWNFARGKHGINPTKITIKEGMTRVDMANIFENELKSFRRDLFLTDPLSREGYLFPDTYFFFPFTTSDEIIDVLTANYSNRIRLFLDDIAKSGHTENEIIIMASLIQKEANDEKDARIISGILWNRISKGMPLQVDADPSTYASIGLPKGPIGNPGLMAIKASLYPEDSPYLYYLHDKTGVVHLAKTYTEHKANISKYLK